MTGSNLFSPIKVGRLELKHRIALAPLTRQRAEKGTNIPNQNAPLYYEQRASRKGTLLITEATAISPQANGYPTVPGIFNDAQVAEWKKVFKAVHDKGSFIYVQLWALGRVAPEAVIGKGNVVSASAIAAEGPEYVVPRPLSEAEIQEYVQWYAAAARRAVDAGADGVEIHGANGYLLDAFLHENANNRTDKYGGSIENRARFLLEVVDAVSAEIGHDRTALRLSPWGTFQSMDPGISPVPQFSYVGLELERRRREGKGLAYVHLVEPRVTGNLDVKCADYESNLFFRTTYHGVLILAGGFSTAEEAQESIERDDQTLIAFGRYFLANPDLVDRLEKGIPLNKYNRDSFYSPDLVKGYIDYPFAS